MGALDVASLSLKMKKRMKFIIQEWPVATLIRNYVAAAAIETDRKLYLIVFIVILSVIRNLKNPRYLFKE